MKIFLLSTLAADAKIALNEVSRKLTGEWINDFYNYPASKVERLKREIAEGEKQEGIIGMEVGTWTEEEACYLYLGKSNTIESDPNVRYIKMHGRKIYEFALNKVPQAMKSCLDKAGVDIHDVNKILIHQANEKMDREIIKRLFRLYKERNIPEDIMPMSIHKLGNSSVATVPTLLDQIRKGTSEEQHEFHKGDLILLASVGAGMNVNAVLYRY